MIKSEEGDRGLEERLEDVEDVVDIEVRCGWAEGLIRVTFDEDEELEDEDGVWRVTSDVQRDLS